MPTPNKCAIEAVLVTDGNRRVVFVVAEVGGRYIRTHPCVARFACPTCGAVVDRACEHPRTRRLQSHPCSTRRGLYRDTVGKAESGRGRQRT